MVTATHQPSDLQWRQHCRNLAMTHAGSTENDWRLQSMASVPIQGAPEAFLRRSPSDAAMADEVYCRGWGWHPRDRAFAECSERLWQIAPICIGG
jgi:hypothetical protein